VNGRRWGSSRRKPGVEPAWQRLAPCTSKRPSQHPVSHGPELPMAEAVAGAAKISPIMFPTPARVKTTPQPKNCCSTRGGYSACGAPAG